MGRRVSASRYVLQSSMTDGNLGLVNIAIHIGSRSMDIGTDWH